MIKKGDFLSENLGWLILIVASFIVILLFIRFYPWTGMSYQEACKQSIVLRSTFNYGPLQGKQVIPLKCRTEKICITSSGDDCTAFGAASNDNPVTKINVADKEGAMDAIADSMYDCNSMLGEGKLDFMTHNLLETNYCLICSRFAFNDTNGKIGDIAYGELYRHLEAKQTPEGKSYLEYIYPGWTSWETSRLILQRMQDASTNPDFKKLSFDDWKINLNFQNGYTIVAQMQPEGTWKTWLEAGGAVGAGVVVAAGIASIPVTGPIGIIVAATAKTALATGAIAGGATFVYAYPENKYNYIPPSVLPYDADTLNGLKCNSFETAP